MSPLCLLFLLILPSYALLPKGTTRHELTFDLEQRLTCFFEEFSKNDRLRVSVVSMEDKKLLLQLRVTSPSGSQSDWTSGDRSASQAWQNLTESGIYEICVHSNAETRVSLNIFAYNEEQLIAGVSAYNDTNLQGTVKTLNERLYSIQFSLKYSTLTLARDEKLIVHLSAFIDRYIISFLTLHLVICLVYIVIIRRLFKHVNKIRI